MTNKRLYNARYTHRLPLADLLGVIDNLEWY